MLRVRGLSFSYPNGKLALVDFGLTVEAGELVVVLGGNGSGKTTLLRCITRTLRPSAGEIWLADTPIYVCVKGKSCDWRDSSWR
jgi:phosphonate transport system ATP-binding protein